MSEAIHSNADKSPIRDAIYYGGEVTYARNSDWELEGLLHGFVPRAWFVELPENARERHSSRPKLVGALAAAARLKLPLVVPCATDLSTPLQALLLNDACLGVGVELYVDGVCVDERCDYLDDIGLVVERLLADRRALVVEVRAREHPEGSVEEALREAAPGRCSAEPSGAPFEAPSVVGPYVLRYRENCATGERFGRPGPSLPCVDAVRSVWEPDAAAVAKWLWMGWPRWGQAGIAALLNEIGLRSRRGLPYTQPMISILIRRAR